MKLEIGGSRQLHRRRRAVHRPHQGQINCDAEAAGVLARQAMSAPSPRISSCGLAWAAPGWISGGSGPATPSFLISWLGCANAPRSDDQLPRQLEQAGATSTGTCGCGRARQRRIRLRADRRRRLWLERRGRHGNSAFNNAVSVIGAHYPAQGGDGGNADTSTSSTTAKNNGKPAGWASGAPARSTWTPGAPALIRFDRARLCRHRRMTAYLNWPLVAAIYHQPALRHGRPGHRELALVRQLRDPARTPTGDRAGRPIRQARLEVRRLTPSGYLGEHRSPTAPTRRWREVAERVRLLHGPGDHHRDRGSDGRRAGARRSVHGHGARVGDPGEQSHPGDRLRPHGGPHPDRRRGSPLTAPAGLDLHGRHDHRPGARARATHARHPRAAALPIPTPSTATPPAPSPRISPACRARSRHAPCADGRSGTVRAQPEMTPVRPIEWQDDLRHNFSLLGGPTWTDYTVKVDVNLQQAGTVRPSGYAGQRRRTGRRATRAAYLLRVSRHRHLVHRSGSLGGRHPQPPSPRQVPNALALALWLFLQLPPPKLLWHSGSTATTRLQLSTPGLR
ncbi:hypothetical protein ACRAWF_27645 [Streptomyces sp. L7]